MQNIALPNKVKFTAGNDPLEEIVTIEPLFPGYGTTLGNALRRVLLSSLPGAAVTAVKINGASHEFMALPGIKEDVLEIILNLKQLRFKIHSEEELRLELKVKGKKTVTAADISKNSQVEIKNPDLVIAHITEDSGKLEAEIIVKEGRGYQLVEVNKKDNKEIGYIQIDSIFSPITLVSIEVKNTRVGKMTNWDKLILNIKTDGTISAEEAFDEAVKILINQYNSLLSRGEEEESAKEILEESLNEENIDNKDKEIKESSEKEEKKESKDKKVKADKKAKSDKKEESKTKEGKKNKEEKKSKVKKEKK